LSQVLVVCLVSGVSRVSCRRSGERTFGSGRDS